MNFAKLLPAIMVYYKGIPKYLHKIIINNNAYYCEKMLTPRAIKTTPKHTLIIRTLET